MSNKRNLVWKMMLLEPPSTINSKVHPLITLNKRNLVWKKKLLIVLLEMLATKFLKIRKTNQPVILIMLLEMLATKPLKIRKTNHPMILMMLLEVLATKLLKVNLLNHLMYPPLNKMLVLTGKTNLLLQYHKNKTITKILEHLGKINSMHLKKKNHSKKKMIGVVIAGVVITISHQTLVQALVGVKNLKPDLVGMVAAKEEAVEEEEVEVAAVVVVVVIEKVVVTEKVETKTPGNVVTVVSTETSEAEKNVINAKLQNLTMLKLQKLLLDCGVIMVVTTIIIKEIMNLVVIHGDKTKQIIKVNNLLEIIKLNNLLGIMIDSNKIKEDQIIIPMEPKRNKQKM